MILKTKAELADLVKSHQSARLVFKQSKAHTAVFVSENQYVNAVNEALLHSQPAQKYFNAFGQQVVSYKTLKFGVNVLADMLVNLDYSTYKDLGITNKDIDFFKNTFTESDDFDRPQILSDSSIVFPYDREFSAYAWSIIHENDDQPYLLHQFIKSNFNIGKRQSLPGYYADHAPAYYFVLDHVLPPFFKSIGQQFQRAGFNCQINKRYVVITI